MKNLLLICLLTIGVPDVNAQSKIRDGTVTSSFLPAANSLLELESNNKGLLFPRVALSATNLPAPLSAHIAGMTVYNTATTGTIPFNVVPAQYYNAGTKWNKVISNSQTLTNLTVSSPTAFIAAGALYDYRFLTESNDLFNAGSTYTNHNGAAGGNFTSSGSITIPLTAGDVVFPRGLILPASPAPFQMQPHAPS